MAAGTKAIWEENDQEWFFASSFENRDYYKETFKLGFSSSRIKSKLARIMVIPCHPAKSL